MFGIDYLRTIYLNRLSRYRCKLFFGKLRRQYLLAFRPKYVRSMQHFRNGACRGCGACCHLAWSCPLFSCNCEGRNNVIGCSIYKKRPDSCRLFPMDEKDLRDRDLLMPYVPCGYRFTRTEHFSKSTSKSP